MGLGALCMLWLAGSLWLLWGGHQAASNAKDHLARWRELPTTEERSTALASALDELETAEARLGNPWLLPWRLVPVANRQLEAASGLTTAARQAATAADDGWAALASGDALSTLDGETLLDIQADLESMHARVLDIEVPGAGWLLGPIADARAELVEELVTTEAEIRDYSSILSVFGELLSVEREIVVVAANNGEMGAGMGMTLSAAPAVLGGEDTLALASFASVTELGRPSGVAIDPDLTARYPNFDLGHIWQYTAVPTPRGPETGRMFLDMWNAVQPASSEVVLAIDSVAVSSLIQLTSSGPIQTPDESIDPAQLLDWLMVGQYELYGSDSTARREAYSSVAGAALAVLSGSEVDPVALAEQLRSLVRGRHLIAYSADETLQDLILSAGMGGALSNDSVAISLSNLGGNKLDGFIGMAVDMKIIAEGDLLALDIEVELSNTATGLEVPYIAGTLPGRQPGELRSLLIFNIPSFALGAESSGPSDLYAAGPDGRHSHQLVHEVRLDPGATARFMARVLLPKEATTLTLEPSGRWPAAHRSFNGVGVPDVRTRVDVESAAP